MSLVASNTFTRALFIGALSLISSGVIHSATVERLSLFVYDGTDSYEDRRVVSPQSDLPSGLTAQFTANTNAQNESAWEWRLNNTSGAALNNLRVTVLLDADISPEDNTFHNEHGKLLQLSAPVDHIAADKWEIGEIGYLTGDLLQRAASGNLTNQSDHQDATSADDSAMALSINIGTLDNDQELTVTTTLADTGTEGLLQADAHNNNQHVFQAYAKLGPITPKAIQAADYAVSKTTSTASINVGDSASYTITISNNGPENGTGVTLTDIVPSQITGVTWTCTVSGTATCNSTSGSGNNISLTGNVPTGASNALTITINGTAISTGTITNTATIAPTNTSETTDNNAANNTSSASITVAATGTSADLSIVKTTTTPNVNVSDTVSYQLTITNAGPDPVTGATITDTVPSGITNVAWMCTATGATCNATSGTGNAIQLTADIPVNGAITIDIDGEAASSGTITNTASVSSTINDPDPANNQSAATIAVASLIAQPIPTHTSIALIALMLLFAGGVAVRLRQTRKLPMLCLAVLASTSLMGELFAQTPDNRGTDFWIGFPLNYSGTNDLTLFIASDVDGKVLIEIPGLSYREEANFIEGTVSSVLIPADAQKTLNDKVAQLGIHVTASAPITLYGLSQQKHTTDAFLALPTPNLGKEYFAVSYSGSAAGSQFMVVGTEDDTSIEIISAYKSGAREAGQLFSVTLQQGETYRLVADGIDGDLTGSQIRSDKPVAVLSGHVCTFIPSNKSACDFIVEQLPPVSSWGKQFITVPLASRKNGDTFRIVAANDETPIYINNSHVITLQKGQYHEFILTNPSIVESGKPALLAQYSNGQEFDGIQADPFMMLVTPVGQYLSHYIVSTPADGISRNYINVVIPESSRNNLMLDGKKVETTFSTLEGTRYQTTQIAVDPGQHIIEASTPFGAYIYGFDTWDSYGYPAGTALRDLGVSFQPLSCLSGIKARAKPNSAQLVWTDTGAEKYAVYRSESYSGAYTKIGETKSRYSTFLDKENLQEKKNYFYRIDELDENDEVQCSSTPAAAYVPETITFGTQINRAPYFVSTPGNNALLRTVYKYAINAIDPDGDSLTYQLLDSPAGAEINGQGEFTWQPDAVGRFTVSVQVSDAPGAVAVQSFEILVRDPNRPPVITSDPVLEADAGLPYSYQVKATDPDNDEITYSVTSNATGLKIDSKTGLISWDVFSTASGQYPIKIIVKDPYGALAQQIFLLNVTPNKAPVITSTPVYKAARGVPYQYQIAAYDPEGEALVFSFENEPPVGMIIDAATGLILWDSPSLGMHAIRVIVSDGVIKTIHGYSLVVSLFEENKPPQISSTPTARVTAGQTYTYNVSTYDPDGDTVALTIKKAPAEMTLTDRQIKWVTTVADIGAHEIELEANDSRGGYVTQSWTLEVIPATSNRAPVISSTPTVTGTAGATYTYQVSATDPNSDPLTYALETAPAEMTVSETGKVEWPIPAGTSGVFTVEIKVSDDKGAYVLQQYKIGVGLPANRPPRIYSQPTTVKASGTNYVYQLSVTDPDGDSLTYKLITAPEGMTINASGRIEWAIPSDATGNVNVEIEVSDGRGGFARQKYTIAIDASSNNRPPLITSQPIAATTSGADYSYKAVATDADGDPIIWTLIDAPEDMTISASGEVAWKVPDDLIGIVEVEIKADDGKGGIATQGYPISVAGVGNRPPRIISTPTTTATTGTLYTYQVSATDQDGDTLTFTLTAKPDDMTISDTGKVEWTPEVAQNGYHNIEITVSDGKGGVAVQTYTLYAQLANNTPPRITSQPIYTSKPGVAYQYTVVASDANNDALTYSLASAPAGMTISADGVVYWDNPITGKYDITVMASDPHGAYVSQSYVLSVGENGVPQIVSQPIVSAIIGELYRYEVDAVDPDGDFLTYQLTTKPTNMTISSDGVIEWTPTAKGSFNVVIRVSDGQDTDTQSYTIVVKDASATIDLAKAVSWIQAQQKGDGSYMYSIGQYDLASPMSATSESLTAFRILSVASSAAQDQAYAFLQSGDGDNTEEISRQIIASVEQGAVNNTLITKLKTYQNDDGGFGTYQGYASHAYETAWALKALVMAGQHGDAQTQSALSWLLNQQQSTGNWLNHNDGDDFSLTAHALDTLWLYGQFYVVQSNLTKAQQWLMAQQSSGQWGSNYKNAMGLRAVAPGLSDISSVQIVVDALLITQDTYGGWDYDVHQTALILQALYQASLL